MDSRLLKAAKSGNLEEIKKLEDSESNIIHEKTPQENTVLHIAARFGNETLIAYLINKHPSLVLRSNLKGETPVHLAARSGQEDVVRAVIKFVDDGIQISKIKDNYGNTPLHGAVKNRYYNVVKAFADKDPDSLVLLNDDGESTLSIAIDLRFTDLAARIINLNPITLEYKGLDGQTPLHRAVIRSDLATMNLILQWKNDLTKEQDEKKRTPLHYAAALGNNKMVKSLIESDISAAYMQDENQQIPLHLAAVSGQESVLKTLIDPCADTIEILDKKQQNILHLAAENGNLNVVQYILKLSEMEDLVNSPDGDGNTPLHLAARNFHSNVVRKLSKNPKVEVRALNNSKRTALATVLLTDDNGMEMQKHLTFKALKSSYKRQAINLEDKSEVYDYKVKADSKSRAMAQTISVMATLIATFTFTAAFTLPGGLKTDNPDQGTALLISRAAFKAFVISDTVAMTSSITAAVIVFWSSARRDNESFMDILPFAIGLTWISLISMTLAFVTGLFVVLRDRLWLAILVCTIGCLAPFLLYIFAPLFLLLFEKFSSSQASIHHRRNIVEENPFNFIFRLIKMRF